MTAKLDFELLENFWNNMSYNNIWLPFEINEVFSHWIELNTFMLPFPDSSADFRVKLLF